MKNTIKASIIFCLLIFILPAAFAALNVSLSDQGTNVVTTSTGENLASGNLNVQVWDAATGGTVVYNETFTNAISNGSWNVMIGENSTNPLTLEYGTLYYKDYEISGEDADFTNFTGDTVERQYFYSPLGSIGPEDITEGNFTFDTATLFIDSTNNRIGINSNLPGVALDVIGDMRTTSGTVGGYNYSGSLTNDGAMSFINASNQYLFMEIASGGNIGIGVPAGGDKLTVSGNTAILSTLKATNYTGTGINGIMHFVNFTGDTLMTITAGGLVGIGAVPAATLDVVGNIQASANITSAKYFGTVPNNGAIYFVNRSNGNNFMEINSLGRVGIGTAPIGTNMLTISGDVSSTGAIEAGDITATVGVSTPEILPPLGSDLVIMNDTEDTLFTVLEAGGVQVNTGDLQVMTGSLTVGMNAQFGGIMNDGTGKVVCILGDKTLGTCTDAINATGECTCS